MSKFLSTRPRSQSLGGIAQNNSPLAPQTVVERLVKKSAVSQLENDLLNKLAKDKEYIKSLGKNGQSPEVEIITCIDSRSIALIGGLVSPGVALIHTNVAATVPPCEAHPTGFHGTSSALEIANKIGVKDILIIGHGDCGGIKHMIAQYKAKLNIANNNSSTTYNQSSSFLEDWMSIAGEDKKIQAIIKNDKLTDEQKQYQCEQQAVVVAINHLMTFPVIADRVQKGELGLHGWHLDIKKAELHKYNSDVKQFEKAIIQQQHYR